MTWQCHVCASPCDGRIRCGECGVVIYCSRRHQVRAVEQAAARARWRSGRWLAQLRGTSRAIRPFAPSPWSFTAMPVKALAAHWRQHSQEGECARFSLQLQGAPAVLDLPFPFLHNGIAHAYHVPIMCLSCAYHVPIMCQSCAYHVPITCLSCAYHVPIMCLSCAYHVPIMCLSCAYHVYHVPIMCLSCAYHVPIMCLSCAYHVPIMCLSRAYHVPIMCLSCAYHVPIMCLSCAYHVPIMCLSCAYHVPITCLSCAYHVPIMCLSCAYHVPIMCLSCAYHVPIMCLSCAYHVPIMCLSRAYHVPIMCLSRAYHVPIMCLSCAYHVPIMCLSCAYHVPIMCLSCAYHVPIMCLSCAYHVPIMCLSCAYHVPIMCLSCAYHVPIMCLSCAYHVPITCLSRAYHVPIMCLSCAYHVPIMCLSCAITCLSRAYHVPIMCLSRAYHVPIMCLSRAYHVPITCLSCAYHVPITCLSCAYHVPITCLSCAYHVRIMCLSCAYHLHIMCTSCAYHVPIPPSPTLPALLHAPSLCLCAASGVQVEQGRHTMCSFLSSLHLHARGPYAALCGCSPLPELLPATDERQTAPRAPSSPLINSASCAASPPTTPMALRGHPTLLPALPPLPFSLLSWRHYYLWRGLPLHSPAALLLHTPLTILLALHLLLQPVPPPPPPLPVTNQFPGHTSSEADAFSGTDAPSGIAAGREQRGEADQSRCAEGQQQCQRCGMRTRPSLCIHVLGADREAQEAAALAELRVLLPGMDTCVHLIGPNISTHMHGKRILLQHPPAFEPCEPHPAQPQPAEPQPFEPQPAEPQPAETQPAEPQPAEPQPAEPQPTEPQPVEPQPAEPQFAEPQPPETASIAAGVAVHFHRGLYHHVLPSLACSPLAPPHSSELANPPTTTAVCPCTSLHHSQHASPLHHSDQLQQLSHRHHSHRGLQPRRSTESQGGKEAGRRHRKHNQSVLPHSSFHQTLMLRQRLPALITDFSHEAAERARESGGASRHGKGGGRGCTTRSLPIRSLSCCLVLSLCSISPLLSRQVVMLQHVLSALVTDFTHQAAAERAPCQTLMSRPSPPHQVLMLRGGLPALITDYSHEAAQQAGEKGRRSSCCTVGCQPALIMVYSHEAAQQAGEAGRQHSQYSQHRAASSLFSHQVLVLHSGLPASTHHGLQPRGSTTSRRGREAAQPVLTAPCCLVPLLPSGSRAAQWTASQRSSQATATSQQRELLDRPSCLVRLPSPSARSSCCSTGCQRSSRTSATRHHCGLHHVLPPLPPSPHIICYLVTLPSSPHAAWGLPALITGSSPHAAAQAASAHHGLQPRGSRESSLLDPHASSVCPPPPHQVLMLRCGLPALITDYSHEAAERAREALCSLAVDVQLDLRASPP
ncbi:unnamed protein product [Closterium sp. NIES-65]|nr:unnamed protein product [Closterium sp. NIES-65]